MASKHKSIKRGWDEDTDMDSDNEMFINNEKKWPRFLPVESANEDLPLQKLSPFAIQNGFQATVRTLKSIKRLRDGSSWWRWGEGSGPKPAPDKPLCRQTSLSLSSQDPELLSGSNKVSGPR